MSYLEELLPDFRKGAKIRQSDWGEEEYIFIKDHKIRNEKGEVMLVSLGRCTDLFCANDWELYQEPKIDWDYIIKNKCLCWFWDNELYKVVGLLSKFEYKPNYIFYRDSGDYDVHYHNCRPVRRDEVTFYEERKDE